MIVFIGIFKVAAHCPEAHASTCVEEWCCRNNDLADRAAVRANYSRPAVFWELLTQHIAALNIIRDISRHVQHVQLAISRAQVRHAADVIVAEEMPRPVTVPPWTPLPQFEVLPAAAARWYGQDIVRLLVSWYWQGVDPCAAVVWISHAQLYIDFMQSTGEPGPIHFDKWVNGKDFPLLGLREIPFKTRVRWFARVMKEILRHMRVPLETGFGRPKSESIAMHTGVWAVPWPTWRIALADQWLCERLPMVATRGGRNLDSLPLADRNVRYPDVVLTTARF